MDIQVKSKTSKQMLYIGIVSMIMMFAGLTSAYIISSKREDWVSFNLPSALYVSTTLIIISSIAYLFAKKFLRDGNRQLTTIFLIITLILGIGFIYFQIRGFHQLREVGLFFTGEGSVVSSSLLVVISFMHILHVMAGIIVIIVVILKHLAKKYTVENMLGLELGGIFWHFVDILWIFLFLFFYFIT